MDDLVELMIDLSDIDGINTVLMVSRDGLAIEGISSTVVMDTDEIGAAISMGFDIAEQMGKNGNLGEMYLMTTEYHRGIIMITSVGDFAILVVMADLEANVGMIRHHTLKSKPALEKTL